MQIRRRHVFMSMTTPRFAAQAIKKIAELAWQPAHYIGNNASSAGSTLKAAASIFPRGTTRAPTCSDPVDVAWDNDRLSISCAHFSRQA